MIPFSRYPLSSTHDLRKIVRKTLDFLIFKYKRYKKNSLKNWKRNREPLLYSVPKKQILSQSLSAFETGEKEDSYLEYVVVEKHHDDARYVEAG